MVIDAPPKISVFIISYNFGKYLRDCIESVLAQTLRPCEIIICDDHSLDDSLAIINEYHTRYPELIGYHRQEKNVGTPRNRTSGLKKSRGDMVAWLDGDDRWLPRKLELEWKAFKNHPDAKIAYSGVYLIDEEGNRTGMWHDGKSPAPPSGDVFIQVFSKRFFPNTNSVFRNQLLYRSTLDEVGYDDENLQSYWDWDLKIRLTARFPAAYSGEALVEYRAHPGGFSKSEPEKHLKAFVAVYEKNLPLLRQRSKIEETLVKCYIEELIARMQYNLPASDRISYYSPRKVFERNRSLIDRIHGRDRVILGKKLSPLFAQLAKSIIWEQVEKGNKKIAFKYLLKFFKLKPLNLDPKLIAKVLLPKWAHKGLKAANNVIQHSRR